MAQLNGNYLNGTNIAVLGTSAHETSEIWFTNTLYSVKFACL